MRIWRYSMENIIHPIQAPRAIFFNSFVCVCGFTSYLNTLRLKTRCYQRLNWRNTNVYLWSGRRATENWVWQGTPEFSVFTPPPKKTPPRSFVPRIWDVKEKECYLVNYTCNLGHLCCRLTHRVLTQKSALHQRSQASQTYKNTCTVKIYITLYFVKKIWITPDAMPIWKKDVNLFLLFIRWSWLLICHFLQKRNLRRQKRID